MLITWRQQTWSVYSTNFLVLLLINTLVPSSSLGVAVGTRWKAAGVNYGEPANATNKLSDTFAQYTVDVSSINNTAAAATALLHVDTVIEHNKIKAQLSLTNGAMLALKVVEVSQDFLSEYVDNKFTYICCRRLTRHDWIYYGCKKWVIYNSKKIAVFTYRNRHFWFLWKRVDAKTSQCLPNPPQHVPIYVKYFPSYDA